MGSDNILGINYDVYLPIIGTVVILGIILNSLTLSYFLWKSQKTIWNRLFTMLNMVDLGINVSGAVIVILLVPLTNDGEGFGYDVDDIEGIFGEGGLSYLLFIVSQVYTFFIMCAAFLIVNLGASSIVSFNNGYLGKVKGIYIALTTFAAIQFFILILGVIVIAIAWFVDIYDAIMQYIFNIFVFIAYLNIFLEVIFLITVFVICVIAVCKSGNPPPTNPPPTHVVIYNTAHSNNSGHLNPGKTNDGAGGSTLVKVDVDEEVQVVPTIQPVTPVGQSFTKINRHTLVTIIWLMVLFLVFEITSLVLLILLFAGVTELLLGRICLFHFFIFRPIRALLNSTLFLAREKKIRNHIHDIIRC